MDIHKNARLTPKGRERIVRQVLRGRVMGPPGGRHSSTQVDPRHRPVVNGVGNSGLPVENPDDRWTGGAARGIRTPDPIITNDVLYQLSYCGLLE